ncbi:MAG: CRISPR system precrRNA processing endoribonuclease RAMP protein Cas6 [Geopsychrobacter sp.]|nr:CRISPR system precrRNA processing endoribonuclease RAMP protein Cas6 [Geopsychrobacter sp.]
MISPRLEKRLRLAEYVSLRYLLRLQDDLNLPAFALIRLRRELMGLLKSDLFDRPQRERYRTLLLPALPVDPLLRRRVQRPAPAFIIRPMRVESIRLAAGDLLPLEVCFFGQGIGQIAVFSQLLQSLGEIGLFARRGRFSLDAIEGAGSVPGGPPLWTTGSFELTPRIYDLSQLFSPSVPSEIQLHFDSPARLLRQGRPLFKADFPEVFPFLLRRVTGMCAIWAELEELFDVDLLLECAGRVRVTENSLNWCDWRSLAKKGQVGGLLGTLTLEGSVLLVLWPILTIGALFGLGKGAAFGAGRYRLL